MSLKVADGPARLEQSRGHLRWRTWDEERERVVHVHQLLMIALGENPTDVFSNGATHVHHKNEVRWDNRPGNLEILPAHEHSSTRPNNAGPRSSNWRELPVAQI